MNMKFYQEFLTVAEAILLQKKYCEGKGMIELAVKKEMSQEEKERHYITVDIPKLIANIEKSKVFDIDDETKMLLLNTTAPKDSSLLKLPFPSIFIDISISKEEAELDEGIDMLKGFYVVEREVTEQDGKHVGRVFNVAFKTEEHMNIKDIEKRYQGINIKIEPSLDQSFFLDEVIFAVENEKELKFRHSILPKSSRLIQQFIYNFVLFMNQPEVEQIHVYRTAEQNEKRMSKGKRALPEVTTTVRLTGKLKEYVNSIRMQHHAPYTYRFWVRGHFRTLRADFWKAKKGMKIWIPPFIKGEGMLALKTYKLIDEKKFEPITEGESND